MKTSVYRLTLPPEVNELLALPVLTLATCGEGGEPHCAAVYFAADENLDLYFFSDRGSQHGLDLDRDGRAAGSIHPESPDWREIHGLQFRGIARVVEPGTVWEQGWAQYLKKFPFVAGLGDIVASNQLYLLRPGWVRLVDNRQGFGTKQEWVRRVTLEGDLSGWLPAGSGESAGGA